jgi:membrane-bound serine protease (ClpP class)
MMNCISRFIWMMLVLVTLLVVRADAQTMPLTSQPGAQPTTSMTSQSVMSQSATSQSAISQPMLHPITKRAASRAVVIPIEGEINDFTAVQFKKRLAQAQRDGADTIILRMDTPGGLVSAAMDIVEALEKAGETMHTISYVQRYAYSAGTLISVACQHIVMAPSAMIGDCAPIIFGQSGLQDVTGANRAKMESPLVATFEHLAEKHGYDPLLLRSFVQYQLVVYVIEKDGQRRFVSDEIWKQLKEDGWKLATDIKNPIDDELTLLTINNTTAAKLGFSSGTFATVQDFADSREITIQKMIETSAGEAIIELLSGSSVRSILSLAFTLSLYFVFSKPGTGIAESVAVLAGAVLFGVPLLTGYAGWLEILLILGGIILIAFEIFIIPGFGLAGISGIVLLLAGMTLTFVPSEGPAIPQGVGPTFLPQLPQTQDAFKEGLIIVTSGLLVSMGLWWWLSKYIATVPVFNRLVLNTYVGQTPEIAVDPALEQIHSQWPGVGLTGIALTDLKPGGVARFKDGVINDDRSVDVLCDTGYIKASTPVVVRERQGLKVIVRAIELH